MLGDISVLDKVYIVCGRTDMRKQIDGLCAIIEEQLKMNTNDNCLFLFCGRSNRKIKGLLWEGDGFLLLYKRLENGKFNWPRNTEEIRLLDDEQYNWLMKGLQVDPGIYRADSKIIL